MLEAHMADIGLPELLILLAIVLLIFGPSKIMGVAAGLGAALRAFRHSMQDSDEVAAEKEQRTENREPENREPRTGCPLGQPRTGDRGSGAEVRRRAKHSPARQHET
jgi:sec-independent protein translocase protein TatA